MLTSVKSVSRIEFGQKNPKCLGAPKCLLIVTCSLVQKPTSHVFMPRPQKIESEKKNLRCCSCSVSLYNLEFATADLFLLVSEPLMNGNGQAKVDGMIQISPFWWWSQSFYQHHQRIIMVDSKHHYLRFLLITSLKKPHVLRVL